MGKYDYLKKYINNNADEPAHNYFSAVTIQEIEEAESNLGFLFPQALKEFWLEIGAGRLTSSINGAKAINNNLIFSPDAIADIMLLKEESEYILPEAVKYIETGYIKENDIIFFDIGDLSSFLVMKPSSDKPDAIYSMLGRIKEEHFERFIWRLYHESPDYYLYV